MNAYITDIAEFLPNEPVPNDRMETLLGMAGDIPSRTRKVILRNNKIEQRHYAIDPATGQPTHSNAQLAAEAIRRLQPTPDFTLSDISCLCCGSSAPDQLMPGHASMVHGELGCPPCEIVSTAGICLSGITSLKYAAMNVALGLSPNAVACGSENSSSYMKSTICGPIDPQRAGALERQLSLSFEADFLRWMLSDGAGAAFISPRPAPDRPVFKIEWIEILSHANAMEPCMYAGAVKNPDGSLTGWRQAGCLAEAVETEFFQVKQDAKLLNREIIATCVERTLAPIAAKHELLPTDIDWYLPHYSSDYFRQELYDHMRDIDFEIPMDRWFTNLGYKGNTGAASIFIILAEFFHSERMRRGDKILCFIPESGRFSIGYMLLTVV